MSHQPDMTTEHTYDPESTGTYVSGPSWKWIAISAIGVVLLLIGGGATLMATVAARHDQQNTDNAKKIEAAETRLTTLETEYHSEIKHINEQLSEIKQLLRQKGER